MNQRKRKKLILKKMDNPSWDYDDTKMWHLRKIKPCRTYSYGCPDCNAVLFRHLFKRFPYNLAEYDTFCAGQDAKMSYLPLEVAWSEVL